MFKKLHVDIPDKFMGAVIGKGYEKLNNISTKTGVTLKAFRGSPGLYFKGSREGEKKAIREVKEIVVSVHWSPCCDYVSFGFTTLDTKRTQKTSFILAGLIINLLCAGEKKGQNILLTSPKGKNSYVVFHMLSRP